MTSVQTAKRKRGRPEHVADIVFNATLSLLSEMPVQSLSFELVAERAGVHKTTLYRRWGTPAILINEVLLWISTERVPMPDTGSLEGDIHALVRVYADHFRSDLGKTINRVLIDNHSAATEAIADWAQDHYHYQLESYTRLANKSLGRREISNVEDFLFATELVLGPMLLRSCLSGNTIDAETETRLSEVALSYLYKCSNTET